MGCARILYVLVRLDSLALTVPCELVPMIVLEMDIATMELASAILAGMALDAQADHAPTIVMMRVIATMAPAFVMMGFRGQIVLLVLALAIVQKTANVWTSSAFAMTDSQAQIVQ